MYIIAAKVNLLAKTSIAVKRLQSKLVLFSHAFCILRVGTSFLSVYLLEVKQICLLTCLKAIWCMSVSTQYCLFCHAYLSCFRKDSMLTLLHILQCNECNCDTGLPRCKVCAKTLRIRIRIRIGTCFAFFFLIGNLYCNV